MRDRRAFLSGLAALPLVGGGVKLIGQPTAVAASISADLLANYEGWLAWERFRLHREIYSEKVAADNVGFLACSVPAENWHNAGLYPGEERCPEPSTRAALVLATVGCPLSAPEQISYGVNWRGTT